LEDDAEAPGEDLLADDPSDALNNLALGDDDEEPLDASTHLARG